MDDEAQLAELEQAWEGVVAATEARERARERASVAAWREDFKALRGEYARLRKAGLWVRGRSDMFGVLHLARAEIRHSRMIAWLLDPLGQHRFGTRLLRGILKRTHPDETFSDLAMANPACEVSRDGTRADIVVWSDSLTLLIENKVDAVEGPGQCDGMYERFVEEPGARFVFLTPKGRRPRSATGDALAAYRRLSYRTVREVLAEVLAKSDPDAPGRPAALDYLGTLEVEFP